VTTPVEAAGATVAVRVKLVPTVGVSVDEASPVVVAMSVDDGLTVNVSEFDVLEE
jgi:hypothetical protein